REPLAGSLPAPFVAVAIEPRQSRRFEKSEACVGRRNDVPRTIREADADVASRAVDVTAREQTRPDAADLFAGFALVHDSAANALVKNSSPPKLPDFSARCRPSGATGDRA